LAVKKEMGATSSLFLRSGLILSRIGRRLLVGRPGSLSGQLHRDDKYRRRMK
jgi:hypothetical protein